MMSQMMSGQTNVLQFCANKDLVGKCFPVQCFRSNQFWRAKINRLLSLLDVSRTVVCKAVGSCGWIPKYPATVYGLLQHHL